MEAKQEKIGKVILDYRDYPGEDFYSEGKDEDELLEIVKNHTSEEFNQIIALRGSWSVLYHLSHLRGNIVDFLPISKKDKVLEVGAGCGAVTGVLSKKAGEVTCIELSRKRSLINAYRNKDHDNIEIKVGNFQDVEKHLEQKYDYIMLVGVLEYALSYINGVNPYERFIEILSKHLTPGGKIVIAIENKYGMKYFAGAREDHTGRYFDSIMGYPEGSQARTFSRDELISLAKKTGFRYRFYYPYPDYKLPTMIYSDLKLPSVGDFTMNERNFDGERFTAFNEGLAFDESVRDGSFPFFSNSFLLVLDREDPLLAFSTRHPIYSKHSNERDYNFRIRTDITEDGYHKRCVIKYPASRGAVAHLESTFKAYEKLKKAFVGTNFQPNRCKRIDDEAGKLERLEFEYLSGSTMADELDSLRERGRIDDLIGVMKKFAQTLKTVAREEFYVTPEFTKIFGVEEVPGRHTTMSATDIDLIFTNLVYQNGWNVLDYEWTFDFPVPVNYVLYRSIRYYIEASADDALKKKDLYKILGMSEEEKATYDRMETSFQSWIVGDKLSLIGMYSIFGGNNIRFEQAMNLGRLLVRPERVRFYYNYGNDFIEENSLFLNAKRDENDHISVTSKLPQGCCSLRIDPGEFTCILKVIKLTVNGKPVDKYFVNGITLHDHIVFYDTADPQIMIENVSGGDEVHIEYALLKIQNEFFLPLLGEIKGFKEHIKESEKTILRLNESKVKKLLKRNETVEEEKEPSIYTPVEGWNGQS